MKKTKLTREDREIIAADVWEKMREEIADDREDLIRDIVDEIKGTNIVQMVDQILRPAHDDGTGFYQFDVPLGIEAPCTEELEIHIFPPGQCEFYHAVGVRSFNTPGEIWIVEATCPPSPFGIKGIDSATFSLDHGAFKDAPAHRHLAYYRSWWTFTQENPLTIRFRPGDRGEPGVNLRWSLFGVGVIPIYSSTPVAELPPMLPSPPEDSEQ